MSTYNICFHFEIRKKNTLYVKAIYAKCKYTHPYPSNFFVQNVVLPNTDLLTDMLLYIFRVNPIPRQTPKSAVADPRTN